MPERSTVSGRLLARPPVHFSLDCSLSHIPRCVAPHSARSSLILWQSR